MSRKKKPVDIVDIKQAVLDDDIRFVIKDQHMVLEGKLITIPTIFCENNAGESVKVGVVSSNSQN